MLNNITKLLAFLFVWGILVFPGQGQTQLVSYQKVKVGPVWAHVVTADLSSERVRVDLYVATNHPSNRSFPHESFHTMIAKTQPTAAIDGTYYDTRTFIPVGTLVSDGQVLQTGAHGVAVCVDENNRVGFYKIRDTKNFPWTKFKMVISTGPTLVLDGKINLYPRAERFRDPSLFKPARRSALGLTKDGKLLLVSIRTPIRLRKLAEVMKGLGAEHAVSLDGGSSTALYYRGDFLVHPSRLLTNILVVNEVKEAALTRE